MKKNKVYLVYYGHPGDCSVSKVCSSYEAADAWRNKMTNSSKYFIEEHIVDDSVPDMITYNVWVNNFNNRDMMSFMVQGNEVVIYSDECLLGDIIKIDGYTPCLRIVIKSENPEGAEKRAGEIVDMLYGDREKFSRFFDLNAGDVIYNVDKDVFER